MYEEERTSQARTKIIFLFFAIWAVFTAGIVNYLTAVNESLNMVAITTSLVVGIVSSTYMKIKEPTIAATPQPA